MLIQHNNREKALLEQIINDKSDYLYEGKEWGEITVLSYKKENDTAYLSEKHIFQIEHQGKVFTFTYRTIEDSVLQIEPDDSVWPAFKDYMFNGTRFFFTVVELFKRIEQNDKLHLADITIKKKGISKVVEADKQGDKRIWIRAFPVDGEYLIKPIDGTKEDAKELVKEINSKSTLLYAPSFDPAFATALYAIYNHHLTIEPIKAIVADTNGEFSIVAEIDGEEYSLYKPQNENTVVVAPCSKEASRAKEEVVSIIYSAVNNHFKEFESAKIQKLFDLSDTERIVFEGMGLYGGFRTNTDNTYIVLNDLNGKQAYVYRVSENRFVVVSQKEITEQDEKTLVSNINNAVFMFRSKKLASINFSNWLFKTTIGENQSAEKPNTSKDTVYLNQEKEFGTATYILKKDDDRKNGFMLISQTFHPNIRTMQSLVTRFINYLLSGEEHYHKDYEDLTPEPEEDEKEETREHTIEGDFDIVDNTTNTDDNNHGGNSVALEVENGKPREEGNDGAAGNDRPANAVDGTSEENNGDSTADEPSASSASEGLDTATDGGNGSNLSAEDEKNQAPQAGVVSPATESAEESTASSEGNSAEYADASEQSQEGLGEALLQSLEEDNTPGRSYDKSYTQESVFEYLKGQEIDDSFFDDISRAFKKIVAYTVNGERTPELDKKLLVKNLITFRNPYNSFKRDRKNDKVLLMVDTSGSMTQFYKLVPYFVKLTTIIPDIVVVEHYNMNPSLIVDNGKITKIESGREEIWKTYHNLIKKYNFRLIINFTDFDGMDEIISLLKKTKARMLIMDVFRCSVLNYQPVNDRRFKHLPKELAPYRKQINYWYGVGDWEGVKYVLNKEL